MYYLKDSSGNAVEPTMPLNESLLEHFDGFVVVGFEKGNGKAFAHGGFKDVACIDALAFFQKPMKQWIADNAPSDGDGSL
jgi:hypothetical protein